MHDIGSVAYGIIHCPYINKETLNPIKTHLSPNITSYNLKDHLCMKQYNLLCATPILHI